MTALQCLESLRESHPELSDWCSTLADLYQKKLWHQLTQKLEQFLALPVFQAGDALIQLYNNFITDFETKINLLKLAHFAVTVSRQYTEREAAISHLEGVIEKIRATQEKRVEEPILYIKMQIGLYRLERGEPKECKKLLDDGKTGLENMTDIDPSVYASYYWLSSQYYKPHQEFAAFYKNALLYLAYTSLDSLSESFKFELAFELSISALLGDNIYDFGELLTHPILTSLLGTRVEWVYYILHAVNSGHVIWYQVEWIACRVCVSTQQPLLAHQTKLIEKINMLCVMEIISRRPPKERTIPLSEIAGITKLSVEDVEQLLVKCLSVHLLEGMMDQVEGTIHVSWVQPRVLEIPREVNLMWQQANGWLMRVTEGYLPVKEAVDEAETPELFKKE